MKGPALARDWLLLGAESTLATPGETIADVHGGFDAHRERWGALGEQLRAHVTGGREGDYSHSRLCLTLGLGTMGYWLVMLAAAVELYPEAAAAASILAEDERMSLPTPLTVARLARAALGLDFEAALTETLADGAARRLGLLEVVEASPGRPTTQCGLRLRAEELTALLSGGGGLGVARSLQVTQVAPSRELVYPPDAAAGAARLLTTKGILGLRSRSHRAGRQFALDAATACERSVVFLEITEPTVELSDLGRLRNGGTVVLDLYDWPGERPFPSALVEAAVARLPSLIVLVSQTSPTGSLPTLTVPPLSLAEHRRVWAQLIDNSTQIDWLSKRFHMGLEEARLAILEAEDAATVEGDVLPLSTDRLARALLAQGSRRMGRAVTHLTFKAQLSDLVVHPTLERQIRDIIGWYFSNSSVERDYGLRTVAGSGPGLACLFSGQPGTGKTFAAQCIANELGLNLYRIDLSQVVSKYIGETEKALARVFDEAEAGHGVLLFDEADALFGKRTDVKDAHDRYANVEVGYLLQRMESFSGIAILTTNLRSNIDSAFVRRLRFILDFPVPDRECRAALWERCLPARHLRRRDLNLTPFVERFRLSGGLIHNIGLAAAHLAAAGPDGLLGPEHVVQATHRELEKAGLARAPADFGPLAHLLPEHSS